MKKNTQNLILFRDKYNNYLRQAMSMFPNFLSSNKESSKQSLKNRQKLIQDTNYVNEIFFGILSTLESLVLFYQKKLNSQNYNNKMFSHYDRVDYKTKNLHELKSQLNSQLYVFLFSRRVFKEQFPQEQWKLPHNFDERKTEQIINYSISLFKQHQDEECLQMVYDIGKIMRGQLNNIYSEKNKIKVQYSESQRQQFKGQSFKHGIYAQGELDKRAKEVEDVKEVSDLKAKINEKNSTFWTQNEPMDIEDNGKQCYLVFKSQMTKEKLENKFHFDPYLNKYKNSSECRFYSTQNEFTHYQKKQLTSQGFTCIVCICADKYGKIEGLKSIQDLSKDEPTSNQDNAPSQLSYIAFKYKEDIKILDGQPKSISYLQKNKECRFARDKEELKNHKLLPIYQKFYIVPVRLNKDQQVTTFYPYQRISNQTELKHFLGQNPEKEIKVVYVVCSKGNILQRHFDKHKGHKLNLQDFAYTVNQEIKAFKSKGEVEDELNKYSSRVPTLLKFTVTDDLIEDIKEVSVIKKYDTKGSCFYAMSQ